MQKLPATLRESLQSCKRLRLVCAAHCKPAKGSGCFAQVIASLQKLQVGLHSSLQTCKSPKLVCVAHCNFEKRPGWFAPHPTALLQPWQHYFIVLLNLSTFKQSKEATRIKGIL